MACFITGLALPQFKTDRAKAESSGLGENNYADLSDHLDTAVINFHTVMNETTNSFLERLTSESNPDVSYPASDEDCLGSNISTYCLAVLLEGELLNFETQIYTRAGDFKEADDESQMSIDEAVKEAQYRATFVDDEINSARQTLELTLATYNEIQNVYPLHMQLKELIKNLESYSKSLSKIRDVVEYFPSKFNDASTIECK